MFLRSLSSEMFVNLEPINFTEQRLVQSLNTALFLGNAFILQ